MMLAMRHLPEGSAGRLAVAGLVAGCLLCSSMCTDKQGHNVCIIHAEEAKSEKIRMQKHDTEYHRNKCVEKEKKNNISNRTTARALTLGQGY